MFSKTEAEAKRQVEICNACRYCEGYCSVFPAIFDKRSFDGPDLTQLANLCHNCRGCYYACQYTAPHEFDLNLPKALAEHRHESWKEYAWPKGLSNIMDRSGGVIAAFLAIGLALFFWLASALKPEEGEGFYAVLSHNVMIAIFMPAFLFPFAAIIVSQVKYWRAVNQNKLGFSAMLSAVRDVAQMKNLKGGHGEGCNFEDEDRFSQARRIAHQLTLWGFLACFASTASGTVLHYVFDLPAPYGLLSLPKLFGVPGGIALCIGTAWLMKLKSKADPNLGATHIWSGEMAFTALLFGVSLSGLALYAATGISSLVEVILPVHLSLVFTLFLMIPYSKMAHGFYRMTALLADQARLAGK